MTGTNNSNNVTLGIGGVAVASVVWGSCFVVCKGYPNMPPDGVHFAFLMSIGILCVGILAALASAPMEDGDLEVVLSPCGLLGGALWATGNFLTVPIIQCVGLGVGLALWAGTNMIVAFCVGAVGLERVGVNLPPEALEHPVCGGLGVVLALCALVVFSQVKSTVDPASTATTAPTTRTITVNDDGGEDGNEQEYLLARTSSDSSSHSDGNNDAAQPQTTLLPPQVQVPPPPEHFEVSRSPIYNAHHRGGLEDAASSHHITTVHVEEDDFVVGGGSGGMVLAGNVPLGTAMAVVAGTLYGFCFAPLAMWNDKVLRNGHIFDHALPSDTIRALRFFFSQCAGIFLTALAGFVLYGSTVRQNKPLLVPPEATLPSILCGAVWAVGCAGAMFATSELGNTVGFPLVLNCSFLVNSAWSILVFQEIQGRRNLQLFGGAFLLNVVSSLLISISKG